MFWLEENLILSNVLIRRESNFDDKYVEKSVQLVRDLSFRNVSLQNPYFEMTEISFFWKWQPRLPMLTAVLYCICWKNKISILILCC